ncbi:MAG: hypothetical protein HYV02_03945 [Deltaproteobacteria bacterium]|nr:hypothetical protein [Deltaproteobacteria bacterium]
MPDTLGQALLGYAVFGVILGGYVIRLLRLWRSTHPKPGSGLTSSAEWRGHAG